MKNICNNQISSKKHCIGGQRYMKITLVLLFACIFQLHAFHLYGQATTLTVDVGQVALPELFKAIEQQSEFLINYVDSDLAGIKTSVTVKNGRIHEILDIALSKTGLSYSISGRYITIVKEMKQSEIPVRGRVTDSKGEPLPGVSIMIKGTSSGTISNLNGEFSLSVSKDAVLVFSYIGYLTREIPVKGKEKVEVVLADDTQQLEEVVVVGYGTQRRASVTSAISSVRADELKSSPAANLSNMILGRLSGVTAIQDNGAPGTDQSRIFVRGVASTGNNDPLYVIDGVPRTALDFQRLASSDIEDVSALKDAAAAAVYGARGANGVILVTTKRGRESAISMELTANFGFQHATRLPEFLDSYGYANLFNIARANEGITDPLYTTEDLKLYKDGTDPIFHPNTNWHDIVQGTAPMQQYNLSLRGGSETVKFFTSFNYLNQKSLLSDINNDLKFNRYNLRSNIDIQATRSTKVLLDVSAYLSTYTEPGAGYGFVFENINRCPPIYAGKYPNGKYGPGFSSRNAWAAATDSGYQRYGDNGFLSRLEITQDLPFLEGLSVKGVAAFDYIDHTYKKWLLSEKIYNAVKDGNDVRYDQVGGFGSPSLSEDRRNDRNLVLEAHLNYTNSFGKHQVGALLLYSQQSQDRNNLSGSRYNYLSDQLDIMDTGSTLNQEVGGSISQYRRQSIVGRATYGYDSKYLVEFSFRHDGSNLFAQGKRFGFFPAVSLGYVITREKFMQGFKFLDNLKLRASYGELGNDQIGQYQYKDLYNYGSGVSMGGGNEFQNNVYLSRLANALVTWEKSRKFNVGFESRWLNDFTLDAEYFFEKRNDILGLRTATIPSTLGVDGILPYENFQKVENKGFEITVGYQKLFNDAFVFNTRLTVSHYKNKVIDIGEPIDKPARIKEEGRSLYPYFGYKSLGIFKTEEEIKDAYGDNYPYLKPGDIHYADLNGDKKIDGEDITYIGQQNLPETILGWNANIQYKSFEFSMFWQGAIGNKQMLTNWFAIPFNQGGKALKAHLDYWSPDNMDAKYPRITTQSSWNYSSTSDFWLYNMSYVRLKNIELAYNVPKRWLSALNGKSLRIYVNAANLLTFSSFKEIDPENTNGLGIAYPQQIVYNVGFQLAF